MLINNLTISVQSSHDATVNKSSSNVIMYILAPVAIKNLTIVDYPRYTAQYNA